MWQKVILFWQGKHHLFIIGIIFICACPVQAQVGTNYFQTDPANLYEWRATMLNPSIGAFQTGALELGFKIFHLGFADESASLFKSGYALLNLPRRLPANINLGLRSQLFTTPIFRETEISLNLSRTFFGVVSLGFGAGIRGISFESDNFNLIDADDPVFANRLSKWQPDLSVGLTIIPFSTIVVGVGVKHLNKPAVSLIDNSMQLNPTITVGVAFNLGNLAFHSSGSKLQYNTSPRGFMQLQSEEVGLLQVGYGEEAAWLKSRLHIGGPISIGYGISYPLGKLRSTSTGNHEAFFVYEFDRLRKIPRQATPPENWIPFIPQMPRIKVVSQFATKATEESVDIYSKRLIREFDEGIDYKVISNLSEYDIGILDTSFVEKTFPFELQQMSTTDSTTVFTAKYSREYSTSISHLRDDLSAKPVDIFIVSPETQKHRAFALGKYLTEAILDTQTVVEVNRPLFVNKQDSLHFVRKMELQEIKPVEEIVLLNPSTVSFNIFSIEKDAPNLSWTLVVENTDGKRVYTFSGFGIEQTEVEWNWRDNAGAVIAPGYYRYYIEWQDFNGSTFRSTARILYARKLHRNIHVKITRKYETPKSGVDKIGVILNK